MLIVGVSSGDLNRVRLKMKCETLDLDTWTKRQFAYWIQKKNKRETSLLIKKFLAEYCMRKFGYDSFRCPIWKRRGWI